MVGARTNATIWGKDFFGWLESCQCLFKSKQAHDGTCKPTMPAIVLDRLTAYSNICKSQQVSSQIEMPLFSFVLRSPPKTKKKLPLSYNFPPKGQLQQGLLGISGMNQRQYLGFRSAHQTLRGRLHQYWILIHLLLVRHLCRSLKAWDWKIKQIKTDSTKICKAQQPPPASQWVVNVS